VRRARRARTALTIAAVAVACALGGLLAVWSYSAERRLSIGTVAIHTSPFHDGALDAYVPLVDWGVRFDAVRAPARLVVELRSVDRVRAGLVAARGIGDAGEVRAEAGDALAAYLRTLALLAAGGALALGLLVFAALRPPGVHVRAVAPVAVAGAVAWAAGVALLLAPRGDLRAPLFYAHGSDIPVALKIAEDAARTPGGIAADIDAQLVGLSRLVSSAGARVSLHGASRITVASDLHNATTAIGALRRAAAGGPVIFAGDLTDRGTRFETNLVRGIVKTGRPFVFVAGNHDSDVQSRALARAGAVVLTQRGRLLADGRRGPVIARVGGLRVAGYTSPNERRAADRYRDRGPVVDAADEAAFQAFAERVAPHVDVLVAHEPELARLAVAGLRAEHRRRPLLVVVGHTHRQALSSAGNVTVVNGGTLGAGGTGNLTEPLPIGLAIVTYSSTSSPHALAVDLVQADPGTGAASARRVRLPGA